MQYPKFPIINARPSDPLEQHWRREQWPSSSKFEDSPIARHDHGSPERIIQCSPESFYGCSALTCTQHPMAGIGAINREGK